MFAPREFSYRPRATPKGLWVNGVNFAPWNSIVSAKYWGFFGLPYIRIELKERHPPFFSKKWLVPIYLGGLEGLIRDVKAYAPPENPFTVAIEGCSSVTNRALRLRFYLVTGVGSAVLITLFELIRFWAKG